MTLLYLVMPYRPEGSLAGWLRDNSSGKLLAPQDVAHFVGQAAAALQHAHNRQIIHQDVKPANFLLRQRDENLSRPRSAVSRFWHCPDVCHNSQCESGCARVANLHGPEQWQGEAVPATDQYALAIMAYELLTGLSAVSGAPLMRLLVRPPACVATCASGRSTRACPKSLMPCCSARWQKSQASALPPSAPLPNAFAQATQRASVTTAACGWQPG